MSQIKPVCKSVRPWLRSNLGESCLAPLTSADSYALDVAVHLADLWGYDRADEIAQAFGLIVGRMQKHTRHLAFHAIAHCLDWEHRFELFRRSGLDFPNPRTVCQYEPKACP